MAAVKAVDKRKRKKRKRRSQAPVALVYFVTVIIFMALLSALSVYLLKRFNIIRNQQEEEAVVTNKNFNDMLARVNSKGVLADITIMRIDPENQSILVIPIPSLMVTRTDPSKTFRDVFEAQGMSGVRNEVEMTFGITIDNYITLTNESFERVADLCGGITYTAPEELYRLSKENDENDISIERGELVTLSGRQIRLLAQLDDLFSNGRQGNNDFLGEAVEELVNSAFQQANVTIDNLDNIYHIMTQNSDTDMDEESWKLQKSYLKDMLTSGLSPAKKMLPTGKWSEDRFVIDQSFVDDARLSLGGNSSEYVGRPVQDGTGTAVQTAPDPAQGTAQPADAQPAETQPAETQPAEETQPAAEEGQPEDTQPPETAAEEEVPAA